MKIGLLYEKFLFTTLEIVLTKMQQKAFSQNEKKFMENFWAQSFFQIPEFRHKIIQSIIHSDDPVITEWRATEFKLEDE